MYTFIAFVIQRQTIMYVTLWKRTSNVSDNSVYIFMINKWKTILLQIQIVPVFIILMGECLNVCL